MSDIKISTYRAVQATAPGKLELVELPLREPGPGEVRIRVEACGVCHSDPATVEGLFDIAWPRVPGHEAVGRIDALGTDVAGWTIGQRVGVGFLGGNCGYCLPCRGGDLINCKNQEFTGIQHDGGYAESMIAKASGLILIPEEFDAADAAPLLCAGLTTFNALLEGGARAGDLVAVIGIGGLGHLAVQFARKMGFEVVAIGRGRDKTHFAEQLGAHHYIDGAAEDVSAALQKLGGAAQQYTKKDLIVAAFLGKGLRERRDMVATFCPPSVATSVSRPDVDVPKSKTSTRNWTFVHVPYGSTCLGSAFQKCDPMAPRPPTAERQPCDNTPIQRIEHVHPMY